MGTRRRCRCGRPLIAAAAVPFPGSKVSEFVNPPAVRLHAQGYAINVRFNGALPALALEGECFCERQLLRRPARRFEHLASDTDRFLKVRKFVIQAVAAASPAVKVRSFVIRAAGEG